MRLNLFGRCAQALFHDRHESVCIISETYANHPCILLGTHGHAMFLDVRGVRSLLPNLQTFAFTGQLHIPLQEDYCI